MALTHIAIGDMALMGPSESSGALKRRGLVSQSLEPTGTSQPTTIQAATGRGMQLATIVSDTTVYAAAGENPDADSDPRILVLADVPGQIVCEEGDKVAIKTP